MSDKIVEAVARHLHARSLFAHGFDSSQRDFERLWAACEQESYRADARAAILAHTQALKAEGRVIVPKEPTEAMRDASGYPKRAGLYLGPGPCECYRAMIAAAESK